MALVTQSTEDGKWLAEWFNDKTHWQAKTRYMDLVLAMNNLTNTALVVNSYIHQYKQGPRIGLDLLADARQARAQIDAIMARVRVELVAPEIGPTAVGPDGYFLPDWKLGWRYMGTREDRTAGVANALERIFRLAVDGVLLRLRPCGTCEKWLFGRSIEQDSCSPRCRQKAFLKSERGRAHRAEYMRRYRAQEKRNDKALAEFIRRKEKGR